jgi:hypothetical protein
LLVVLVFMLMDLGLAAAAAVVRVLLVVMQQIRPQQELELVVLD